MLHGEVFYCIYKIVIGAWDWLCKKRGGHKKAYENIIVDKVVRDKVNAKKLVARDAEITFQNINFAYGKNTIFKNFNLTIKKSEKVGIVGLSGAGKTTICYLLLRMYDISGGKIMINNIPLS